MKSKILAISLVSAATCCISMQQAKAEGDARFKFAPTYWRREQPHVPAVSHLVQQGSVPMGSKFLGLDPAMLATPEPTQTVTAHPYTTQVTPRILPGSFCAAFGQPSEPSNQQAPMPAIAKALPVHRAHQTNHHANHPSTVVAAKLVKHMPDQGLVANAGNRVESYGKNFGYVPGPYVPTQSDEGLRTQTDVQGKLLRD